MALRESGEILYDISILKRNLFFRKIIIFLSELLLSPMDGGCRKINISTAVKVFNCVNEEFTGTKNTFQ